MKRISFYFTMLAALLLGATGMTSCSDDDDDNNVVTPQPEPEPEPAEHHDTITVFPYHFDLTVTAGNHGGMNKDKSHLTITIDSLTNAEATIDFTGKGAEITDYTVESIVKGKYMYQVPNSNDRFSKLQFKDNKMVVVQEQPFVKNTYKARNYTHAWLNDNTLLIMSTNGEHTKVIWTKLNADDMTIVSEGELTIAPAEEYNVLTTSGILAYRQSDNKLFYFFYSKKETSGSKKTTNEPFFRIAVINPATMAVEQEIINKEAAQTTGSAYGELLQQTVFFDEKDNLYLAAFSTVSKKNLGQLLRIKKGEFDFEAGYNAFPDALGKLLTVQYLGSGKALAYAGDASEGTGIDDIAYYYAIIDVNSKTVSRLAYNGTDIPYSGGSFSQRSVYVARENKAYFGVNTADEQCIYIYDVATGSVTKGLSIANGYYFDQIRMFDDDPYKIIK